MLKTALGCWRSKKRLVAIIPQAESDWRRVSGSCSMSQRWVLGWHGGCLSSRPKPLTALGCLDWQGRTLGTLRTDRANRCLLELKQLGMTWRWAAEASRCGEKVFVKCRRAGPASSGQPRQVSGKQLRRILPLDPQGDYTGSVDSHGTSSLLSLVLPPDESALEVSRAFCAWLYFWGFQRTHRSWPRALEEAVPRAWLSELSHGPVRV